MTSISRDHSEVNTFPSASRSSLTVYRLWGKKMPTICVAAGCSNQKDKAEGISLHVIPFFEDERPEAKRRRKKWVDFVKQKRAKWQPSKYSVICSVHFKPEDFERRFDCLQQGGKAPPRWLRKDEFGCCVFPTIHAVGKNTIAEPSKREKRMVSHYYIKYHTFGVFAF